MTTSWNFDNSYGRLPHLFYTKLHPTPVRAPELVLFNQRLAASMGLDAAALQTNEGIEIFAGNRIPEGALPIAQAYAGHQFGHFTMLGDGRALLIGEQITPQEERLDIQLKGSGRTPYSRGGDGRAGLGPMLREYIISEAMHALGIPTTRSLAVVTTGEPVYREVELNGAILTRVASSHLRVGTFQYAANWGTLEDLKALADYAIHRHFPQSDSQWEAIENRYLYLLQEVIKRQAKLIAKWQLAGFIHGVMNTDNTTISGETIDYGPCAFMDAYDPSTVFSSIDYHGRYAYGNQPLIGAWNLARLAESLLPLLHDDEKQAIGLAEEAIADFHPLFEQHYLNGMRAKLGMYTEEPEDESLVSELLGMMQEHHSDYTNTFRALTYGKFVDDVLFEKADFKQWHMRWQERLKRQDESQDIQQLMRNHNPAVIPRNHRVEEALEAAVEGDDGVLKKLLAVLSKPYDHAAGHEEYALLPEKTDEPYQTFCGT